MTLGSQGAALEMLRQMPAGVKLHRSETDVTCRGAERPWRRRFRVSKQPRCDQRRASGEHRSSRAVFARGLSKKGYFRADDRRDEPLHRDLSELLSKLSRHRNKSLPGGRRKACRAGALPPDDGVRGDVPDVGSFHADQHSPPQTHLPRMRRDLRGMRRGLRTRRWNGRMRRNLQGMRGKLPEDGCVIAQETSN